MEGRRTYICRLAVGLLLHSLALGQTCDRYWLLHEDTCWRHFTHEVSYLEAKRQCSSVHAQLLRNVTVDLAAHLLGPREQSENSSFWCETESDIDDMFSMPRLILERRRRSASCCYIQNLEYEMGECDQLRGYICEKDPIPRIHICLQNSTISTNASSWESARRYCQCNGGDLYSFNDTSEEHNFLQIATERNQSMWIGLRREADSNEFLWSDGTPLTHSVWAGGRPSTDDNSKLCVAYIAKNATWDVIDCNSEISFRCKSSGNTYETLYSEYATETTPYDVSSDETVEEASTYNPSYSDLMLTIPDYLLPSETETETDWYNSSSYEDNTMGTDWYNVSDEDDTTITITHHVFNDNTTTETALWSTTTEDLTTNTALTNASIVNSTADSGYISACSPLFENCSTAGLLLGIIIFLTAVAIAVAYSRLRKKKETNQEAPVQLLHVQSYKEEIPAKVLAAKIKEVIA